MSVEEKCIIPQCDEDVAFLFVRVDSRTATKLAPYCRYHGENFLDHYSLQDVVGVGEATNSERGTVFDIEVMAFSYGRDYSSQLLLREVGGARLVWITMGVVELSAIRWEVEKLAARRPRTHQAMRSTMEALGGKLDSVIIDSFFELEGIYTAKLIIRHGDDESIIVDLRPSDAITLAVICDAPIYVSKEVLVVDHDDD